MGRFGAIIRGGETASRPRDYGRAGKVVRNRRKGLVVVFVIQDCQRRCIKVNCECVPTTKACTKQAVNTYPLKPLCLVL